MNQGKPGKQVVSCARCGKKQRRFPSHVKPVSFCSRACWTQHGRIQIQCSWLGCTATMPARQAVHHGRTVYKTVLTRIGDYIAHPLCLTHTTLLRRARLRPHSLHRVWADPDRVRPDRSVNSRGLRLVLFDRVGGKCQTCSVRLRFDAPMKTWIVDHIVPIFRGGLTTLSNLQVLCARCERKKTGLEKTEVATLRWSVGRQSGTRWMTHTEKDVLIAALTQERDALLAQVSARPS